MSRPQRLDRVAFIVLRFMRTPILVLVVVYAVSMVGMVLIPGPEVDGEPSRMGFFHAFYFLTYTATTTGFGEIPHQFSEAQRMWAIVSLYVSVIAWLYAIGSIFHLVQNPHFQQALSEWRFARKVERISEPFVILCGFGNTGSLLARGLSDFGMAAVVLDQDEERIKALVLRDYRVPMPGLTADARDPRHLIDAGLVRANCQAVVALTNDESVNQKIAVTAALLNPALRVITLTTSESYREVLTSLTANTHVIDPFQTYARFLGACLKEPRIYMLNSWIIGAADRLEPTFAPPRGLWIICGYGRMGHRLEESLGALGIETVFIENEASPDIANRKDFVVGRVSAATLTKAGIQRAAGIVAGTNNDYDNLSIVVTARALNPGIFCVVRQNRYENQVVYAAARADLVMQPSLVSARRMLLLLTAPLLRTLFTAVQRGETEEQRAILGRVVSQLRERVDSPRPRLWSMIIGTDSATAVMELLGAGRDVTLGDILRDPRRRDTDLACVALVLRTGEETALLPPASYRLQAGDEILFCGTLSANRLLDATLNNAHTLSYLIEGVEEPRGYVMQWLQKRRVR